MNCSFSKQVGIALLAGFFSLSIFADPVLQMGESFQTVCTDAWMKKSDDVKDQVDYKNFGEKYCACTANQPSDNEEAIQKAIHWCMSRTLLHDALDSLEDEIGLSKVKDSDITEYCRGSWNLVYPKLSDEDKKLAVAYCECIQPQLMELIKQSDDMPDAQFDEGVDHIAAACSSNAIVRKSAATN